jgi:hypothetical protein
MSSKFDQNVLPAFDSIKDDDETILWVGKPKYLPFILPRIFLASFFVLVGIIIESVVLFNLNNFRIFPDFFSMLGFLSIIPISLGMIMVLSKHLGYSNICYAYSDRRILIRRGFMGTDFIALDYNKITDVGVDVSIFGKVFNTGTIHFSSGNIENNRFFWHIKFPYETFKNVSKLIRK